MTFFQQSRLLGSMQRIPRALPRGNLLSRTCPLPCNINKSESAQVHHAKEAKVLWKWLRYDQNIKSQNLSLWTTGGSLACCTKLTIASAVPNSYGLRRSPACQHNVFAISKHFSSRSVKEHHGRISAEMFSMLRATWPPVRTAGTSVLQGQKYTSSCRQSIRLDSLFMFLSQERVLGLIYLGVAECVKR